MNAISQCSFSLKSLHEQAYQLKVQFPNGSNKIFTFIQQSSLEKGEIVDIYSQNGACSASILNGLFQKKDVQGIQKAVAKLQEPLGPSVMALDLHDPNTGYVDCQETIPVCEEAVCSFLKESTADGTTSKSAKKVHALFQKTLDFVICEGSLKMDLLKGFSPQQVDYFLSAPASFCQCAELFMNSFKFGQEVDGILAEKYIKSVSSKFSVFKPYEKSTVFYPAMYKEIYSVDGSFAKGLKPVFSVSGGFDAVSKITTISLEMLK